MVAYGSCTYAYDAFGQRVRKTELGSTTYYITSGSQVLTEYTSNGNLDAEYIYALGRIIAILKPGRGYYWVYIDHLKSTRLVDGTDEFQTDMRRDYYPYGEAYTAAGNNETAYQFTQKTLDNLTGFYYFGARYYDPSIGRWFVPDPANQGFSPYVYCGNRPLVRVDPEGQFPWLAIVIGMYIGGALYNQELNPSKWDWNDPYTYISMAAGGFTAGYFAAVAYPTTGIGLSLQGILVETIVASSTVASTVYYASSHASYLAPDGSSLPRFDPFGNPAPEFQAPETPDYTFADYYRDPITVARSLEGTPYDWGGTSSRTGFDCSGYVWYCYAYSGRYFPREQYLACNFPENGGGRFTRIYGDYTTWESGDILVFRTARHMGIWDANSGGMWHAKGGQTRQVVFDSYGGYYWKWIIRANHEMPEVWRYVGFIYPPVYFR